MCLGNLNLGFEICLGFRYSNLEFIMKYLLHPDFKPIQTKIDYKTELNAEQFEVIKNASGPCLVLAGAGSGKTRTLVYLTAYLLEHKIPPQNIMLVTFTNKASKEMLNRVEVLLKYHPRGLWGGTFHHLANIILRKYAKLLGYGNNFTILDNDDAKSLMKNCVAELGYDIKNKFFPKPDVIHSIVSFHQNSLIPISDIIANKFGHLKPEIIPTIEKIFQLYQKKKKVANSMDFDDLLGNWHTLLKKFPETKSSLSKQLYYILVDEYQDTNTIQAEIIEELSSVHKNVVVVGDDSQSIYSFRAADINNILHFPKTFKNAKIFRLETNYRSTPQILELANHSIKNNRSQFEKNLKSVKTNASKPALAPLGDSYQQAEFVCQRILELQEEGVELKSIAVLFRAAYQALELELELNKKNILYEMRGGMRFFEQAHIKDVIAFLKIFNNIKDELSWKRVLQMYPGIGPAAAQKLWEHINAFQDINSLIESKVSASTKAEQSFQEILSIFYKLIHIEEKFIATALNTIMQSGYKKYVESAFENARDRIEDLEQLANFALSYKNLDNFLSEVTLSEAFKGVNKEGKNADKDALILSTIHQAKGLEWKAVFIIGLIDGQFPHRKVFEKPQEMEEERRLFYVAATRAQDELYLTYPIISSSYLTGQNINRPSTFLRELDENLFEKWEVEGDFNLPTISYDDENDDKPGILKMIKNL